MFVYGELAQSVAGTIVSTMRAAPLVIAIAVFAMLIRSVSAAAPSPWSRENVAAWCIVPYDAKHRGPVERAEMLQRLQLTKLAYDYRDEHIPTFETEVNAMREHNIAIVAWWFPVTLDPTARKILNVIETHRLTTQLWVSGWESEATKAMSQTERVRHETERLRPIVTEAKRLGCKVGLYNHGGWFGEPDNQLAVLAELRRDGLTNVGLVYNFHHGHAHIAQFPALWSRMQRDVLAVNLNGMFADGEATGRKIVPLSQGADELAMMRVIDRSGWRGLVGVLNHQPDVDAEAALALNLAGLEKLATKLETDAAK